MNVKSFASVAASAGLALMMVGSALAADATTTVGTSPTVYQGGFAYVNHGYKNSGAKDLVVEAGADPSSVELHFEGAQKVEFADVGTLRITRSDGTFWIYKPSAYQVVNGKQRFVPLAFHAIGKDRVALRLGKFDASAPLVVGPVSARNGNS
jgi:hypothetical protein